MRNSIISVSQLNNYIKKIIQDDDALQSILVRGEISNFTNHYSGHMYFVLKDNNSKIKCIMFKGFNRDLAFAPEDGMKVIADGYVSVYERDGQYQLYVRNIIPDGIGALHIAYEQLKKKLISEGLFEDSAKKPIPTFPERIGVVTSGTGAAVRDIINVSIRRNPGIDIVVAPVAVQGKNAAGQIAKAIQVLNYPQLSIDVIIVGRGGGSIEELWAFNEEVVARSIYASEIPVISAVGHETDYTITDFVSDLRAPTPSAAAELAVPDVNKLCERQKYQVDKLLSMINRYMENNRQRLKIANASRAFRKPFENIYQERQYLDNTSRSLMINITNKIQRERECNNILMNNLRALSPLSVLGRGYGIIKKTTDGVIIKSVSAINKDESIDVDMIDGTLVCEIKQIIKGDTARGKGN